MTNATAEGARENITRNAEIRAACIRLQIEFNKDRPRGMSQAEIEAWADESASRYYPLNDPKEFKVDSGQLAEDYELAHAELVEEIEALGRRRPVYLAQHFKRSPAVRVFDHGECEHRTEPGFILDEEAMLLMLMSVPAASTNQHLLDWKLGAFDTLRAVGRGNLPDAQGSILALASEAILASCEAEGIAHAAGIALVERTD